MDHKRDIDNDSIENNGEQLSPEKEMRKAVSIPDQVETTTNIKHKSEKERKGDEVANSEDNNEGTENIDDVDGVRKVVKAIISCSSRKYRPKDEDNGTYGFEEERRSRNKSSKTQTVIDPDHYNFNHPERGHMVLIVNDTFKRVSFRD